MMRAFFYPAIALMNRLGYTRKFALLGALFLIAIAVLTYSLFVSLDAVIRTSQRQLESISLVKPIYRTVQAIQLHRGLAAAVLGGNEMVRDRRTAKEKEVAEALAVLEERLRATRSADEGWHSIKASWEALRKEGDSRTAAENFSTHTRLIEQLLHLEAAQIRNIDADMFYLIDITANRLPSIIEHIGRLRAYGTGILARQQISEEQKRALYGLIANLRDALPPLENSFVNAARYNPAQQAMLTTVSEGITDSVRQIIHLVESDVLTGQFTTSPEYFLTTFTTVIDGYYLQLYESLLPSVEALIQARITEAEDALRTSIGVAFLLFWVVVYFSIGSYYATVGSIRSLAHSASAFASGELNARISLGTNDELRQVGDSFNEMADGFVAMLTERKQAEEKMTSLAYYDTLTGLPNRTLFYDRLAQAIKQAHRADLKMALLFIDLDKFKEVNDTLGHNMGDILLKEAARRISDCVREADTVARLGGDEFIIILPELVDTRSIERVAECILQKLAGPFPLGSEMAYVSASMGITLYPDDATTIDDLLKQADQAMYVAKNAGGSRHSYFTPALQTEAQSRLHLLNDLRGALAGGQFRLDYQPIVELNTGRINKAEALIRWQHPKRGLIGPEQFITLAEESGLIVEIGDWVFKQAAQQVKHWRTSYNTDFQISVNKSPTQFRQSGHTYQSWLGYLRELGLPGQSITIEITEGLLLDAATDVTDKLLAFRDAGMQVAIDDFGTGYSSLSYLKKFDIDYLKIDQSFVQNLATDSDDMVLSEAIIVMAHKLGLKVVAEGVETEAQRKLLADAGCDYAQGYLFSRPLPARELEALLEQTDTNPFPV